MMTRRALARQDNNKLQRALSELKSTKQLCEELNKERDENEREQLDLLNMNKKLKLEMSELHSTCNNIIDERNRLQLVVDGFNECSMEYVKTLCRINLLEHQLQEAYRQITPLEAANKINTASLNQSLFDELITGASDMVSATFNAKPMVIIDLTNDSVSNEVKCSRNKLKKYVKINKYIRKTQKIVRC